MTFSGLFRPAFFVLICFSFATTFSTQQASAQKEAAQKEAAQKGAAQKGFEEIFNGKDLTGWVGDTELWSVQDGAITGITQGKDHLKYNKFLIWEGGQPSNFELRLKFRLEGDSNSGVQYRSQHLKDAGEYVVGGYQADIHPKLENMGMLYDERGRGILTLRGKKTIVTQKGEKKTTDLEGTLEPLDLTEWQELTIVARGNRLIHKLNGTICAVTLDNQKEERESEGVIAFQVHRGPAMKIQFKDIRLKKLPAPKRRAGAKKGRAKKDGAKKEAASPAVKKKNS